MLLLASVDSRSIGIQVVEEAHALAVERGYVDVIDLLAARLLGMKPTAP